jgi:hypothetical protein
MRYIFKSIIGSTFLFFVLSVVSWAGLAKVLVTTSIPNVDVKMTDSNQSNCINSTSFAHNIINIDTQDNCTQEVRYVTYDFSIYESGGHITGKVKCSQKGNYWQQCVATQFDSNKVTVMSKVTNEGKDNGRIVLHFSPAYNRK